MKNGTGLTEHSIDYENKTISINFSSNYHGECYRNDPSIFFFAANSYRSSFYVISKHMNNCFENRFDQKEIEHLILPYVFSFRHYLELELKAIISSITNKKVQDTHSLKDLMHSLEEALKSIPENEEPYRVFQLNYQENKTKALDAYNTISGMIKEFLKSEPSVEYYRYLFKTKMTLDNPILKLDFNNTDKLFKRIDKEILELNKLLRDLDVYVYFTL